MEHTAFNDLIKAVKNAPSDLGYQLLQEYRKTQSHKSEIRMYAGAKQSRLTSGWGQTTTSADSELSTSLRTLRARSRAMMRDAPYAKRAKIIVVNNVVGAGIGMQGQVKSGDGKLVKRINDEVESAWEEWTMNTRCHTGGILHLADIERMAMGQIFETGEIFIRKHYRSFGDSSIPFALEIIEPERVIDEFQPSAFMPDATVRLGVESDEFRRPLAYWIRKLHPGEIRYSAQETDRVESPGRADLSLESGGTMAPDAGRAVASRGPPEAQRCGWILRGGDYRSKSCCLLYGDNRDGARLWRCGGSDSEHPRNHP